MQCIYLSILIHLKTVQKKHWLLKQIPYKCPKGQPSITEGLKANVASMSVPTSKAVARSWVHSDKKLSTWSISLSVHHGLSIPCTLKNNPSKFRRLSKACMVHQNGGWRWLQLAVGPALASWHFCWLCWNHWEVLTSKEACGRLLNLEVPLTTPT